MGDGRLQTGRGFHVQMGRVWTAFASGWSRATSPRTLSANYEQSPTSRQHQHQPSDNVVAFDDPSWTWANESFTVAQDFICARSRGKNKKQTPIILPDSYIEDATPIVSERIEKAGVRLAWVLNQAFR